MKKCIVLNVVSIEILKTLRYHIFSKKHKCGNENKKIFKEEWVDISKILGLIKYMYFFKKYGIRKHNS